MGQEVVYFLEAETWVTKRLGSGGGQEANKMADEEARSFFSHRPATDFNLRQQVSFFGNTTCEKPWTRWLEMRSMNEYSFNPGKSDGLYSLRIGS